MEKIDLHDLINKDHDCKDKNLLEFYFLETWFILERGGPELFWDILESIYVVDGEIPFHFIKIGWISITFECKWLYELIYLIKYRRSL